MRYTRVNLNIADLLGGGGLPLVGDLLGGATGAAGGLPLVGNLPLVNGVVPSLLNTVNGVVGGLTNGLLGGVVGQLPLGLECLSLDEIKQKCGILNVVTRCEKTDCKNTAVCVDVCLGIPLVDSLVGALTGQCVCKDGFYKDQRGTCVSLQTCLDVNLNASGRKKRDLPLVGNVLGGGLPLVGNLPLVNGLVPSLLNTVNGVVGGLTNGLLGGVVGGATGAVGQLPLGLQCLSTDLIKEKCSLLQAVTLCEKTDCQHTQVCVDVCLNLLNNVLSAVTGQCVCQDGFYKDKQGTCVSLQTCLDVNLNASG